MAVVRGRHRRECTVVTIIAAPALGCGRYPKLVVFVPFVGVVLLRLSIERTLLLSKHTVTKINLGGTATGWSHQAPIGYLMQNSHGKKAVLAHLARELLDNRPRIPIDACATASAGMAERD